MDSNEEALRILYDVWPSSIVGNSPKRRMGWEAENWD